MTEAADPDGKVTENCGAGGRISEQICKNTMLMQKIVQNPCTFSLYYDKMVTSFSAWKRKRGVMES